MKKKISKKIDFKTKNRNVETYSFQNMYSFPGKD